MIKLKSLALSLLALPIVSQAGDLKMEYVDWGIRGTDFPEAVATWQKGQKWSTDDNFFISRVRAKQRFRNSATQVNPALDETNDKKLIFWVPINREGYNALPDGVFDREVFPMWSYITHYGNWSTTLIRMPGNFMDVAHKNGVPVSVVASVPWGNISDTWKRALTKLVEVGAPKIADYLEYYGVDGLGYNSEFKADKSLVEGLADFHSSLVKLLKGTGRMPLHENIWYDGTNEMGNITFDRGLDTHNDDIWGYGDDIKTSLFFNYNWNDPGLLDYTVANANKLGRTPLDLYIGINMQGKEPHNSNPTIWPLIVDRPLSIGLWGAHSENMFFESRGEKGTRPDLAQRSYMLRMERWFTGGTRNPLNTPAVSNSLKLVVDNYDFFGMSKMMSARSSLKWDLSEEPFFTYFNLGNGTFFNYQGNRCHSSEWYNIGIQDYLPTWRWWFADKFLGRDAADVPSSGLDAEFIWDDAWIGGSLMRVFGSASDEYLHLFKTEFGLRKGDVITVRYKVMSGSADAYLALSAKGSEGETVDEQSLALIDKADPRPGFWQRKKFVIGEQAAALDGKDLAMIAIRFRNADNFDVRLGEISIYRPGTCEIVPSKPVIEKAELLAADHNGVDAKIIFNMPNNKGNDVCYNTDVNTSYFKLYARQEGKEPVLMGMTPSWAGLMFSIPVDLLGKPGVSLGVSALSLNMRKESEIAWSDYMPLTDVYAVSDDIRIDKSVINPGEEFTIFYVDPLHGEGNWELIDSKGNIAAKADNAKELKAENGLPEPGAYTLRLTGPVGKEGSVASREFVSFIQIYGSAAGSLPEILTFTAEGEAKERHDCASGEPVSIAYTAKEADGAVSRGIHLTDKGFGFLTKEAGYRARSSFSISFWIKPESFEGFANHMLNIRDKEDAWSRNNWGWFWHVMNPDGTTSEYTIRTTDGSNLKYRFGNTRIQPGVWHHLAYVFEFDAQKGVLPSFYLDGVKQEVTSWSRGDEEHTGAELDYQKGFYAWRGKNVAAVGGYLHKNGSVRGELDNFMYWGEALDQEGVRLAMGDIAPADRPESLWGYFDFEDDCDEKGGFASKGTKEFTAGVHEYEATEVEGQGTLAWRMPQFAPGCPYLAGEKYKIETKANWQIYGADILSSEGDALAGNIRVSFPRAGYYTARLTLSNQYGSDVRKTKINVDNGMGISGTEESAVSAYPNPFRDAINFRCSADGDYTLRLLDMEGKTVASAGKKASAGEVITLRTSPAPGVYLLSIEKKNGKARTVKMVKL